MFVSPCNFLCCFVYRHDFLVQFRARQIKSRIRFPFFSSLGTAWFFVSLHRADPMNWVIGNYCAVESFLEEGARTGKLTEMQGLGNGTSLSM